MIREQVEFSSDYDRENLYSYLKSTFSSCDHQDVDGFTFSIYVSGARGGNCYGDNAESFHKDSHDIVSEISDEISYRAKEMLDHISSHYLTASYDIDLFNEGLNELARSKEDSQYHTYTESEYYGNYYDYNSYFVSINEVLELSNFSDEVKSVILEVAKEVQEEVQALNYQTSQFQHLLETQHKIANFEKSSATEKNNLEAQIKRLEKETENAKAKLSKIDKTQGRELEHLKTIEKNIIEFLGEEYIASQPIGKKKKY